jgi:CheY-like chemotaxis protein
MNLKKLTVLIVEDDTSLIELYKMFLEEDGYKVISALNGKDALDLLLSLNEGSYPDCILLDLKMPIMDGATLLKIMKTSYKDRLSKIPVVIYTAYRYDKDYDCDQVFKKLIKPESVFEISSTIAHAIASKKIEQRI